MELIFWQVQKHELIYKKLFEFAKCIATTKQTGERELFVFVMMCNKMQFHSFLSVEIFFECQHVKNLHIIRKICEPKPIKAINRFFPQLQSLSQPICQSEEQIMTHLTTDFRWIIINDLSFTQEV